MTSSAASDSRFSSDGVYTCPVCRHGQISPLPLMEALSCDFCRHIFTANLHQQSVTMVDSSQPLTWRWNGKTWQSTHHAGVELSWGIKLGLIALVVLPTSLIGLAAYIFPPVPGSPLGWVPIFWTGLTFLSHLAFVVSLLVDYYQFPILVYWRARRQNLVERSR